MIPKHVWVKSKGSGKEWTWGGYKHTREEKSYKYAINMLEGIKLCTVYHRRRAHAKSWSHHCLFDSPYHQNSQCWINIAEVTLIGEWEWARAKGCKLKNPYTEWVNSNCLTWGNSSAGCPRKTVCEQLGMDFKNFSCIKRDLWSWKGQIGYLFV